MLVTQKMATASAMAWSVKPVRPARAHRAPTEAPARRLSRAVAAAACVPMSPAKASVRATLLTGFAGVVAQEASAVAQTRFAR